MDSRIGLMITLCKSVRVYEPISVEVMSLMSSGGDGGGGSMTGNRSVERRRRHRTRTTSRGHGDVI